MKFKAIGLLRPGKMFRKLKQSGMKFVEDRGKEKPENMKEEVPGKGSAFINRLGSEFLATPMYVMYLGIALLGMFCVGQFVPGVEFKTLDYLVILSLFVLFFGITVYVSLGNNYHDIIVSDEQISIVNRIPGFRQQIDVPLREIEEVLVGESHIDLERPSASGLLKEAYQHPERKWLEIKANGKRFRWNCYGLADGVASGGARLSTVDQLVVCLESERNLVVKVVGLSAA